MRNKVLVGLGIAAVVAIGAAIFAVGGRQDAETAVMQPTPLFPGLSAKIGDVTALTVAGAKQKLTIADQNGTWVIREKSDYPAKPDAVRAALAGLVDLKAIEPRTDKPDLYGKIGVADIDKPDSKAIRLGLADAKGQELAALLVGDTKAYESGSHPAQLYVRKPGEARSWLAEGRIEVKTDPMTWIERSLTHIARGRIMSVDIVQPDGRKLEQSRDTAKQEDWKVTGLKPDAKPKMTDMNGTGAALEFLTCDDVAKLSDVNFDKPVVATFHTFDGLVVTVKTIKQGDKPWIALSAGFDPAQAAKVAPPPANPPAADKAAGDKSAGDKPAEPAADQPRTAADVEKEAAEFNKQFSPWAYQIPDYQAGNYSHTPEDVTMTEKKGS